MNKYLDKVCSRLLKISADVYHEEHKEVALILQIMAQASNDIYSKVTSEMEKREAIDYFYSDNFLYHCSLAGYGDEDSVRKLFMMRPERRKRHVVL